MSARFGREADELRVQLAALGEDVGHARARGAAREPRGVRHAPRHRADGGRAGRAGRSPAAVPRHPRRRHERQDVDRALLRRDARGARPRGGRLPVAARPGVRGARAARRRAARRGAAGRGRRARRGRRAAGRAAGRRAADAVRGADGGRVRGPRHAPGAEVVAVEAGLGGRYDATNVLAAPVVAAAPASGSTTRRSSGRRARRSPARSWPSSIPAPASSAARSDAEIAPVLRAAGPRARRGRGAAAAAGRRRRPTRRRSPRRARSSARTWRVALAGCERLPGIDLDRARALRAAAAVRVPGRLETVGTAPLTVLDGAHNPHAAAALAAELPALLGARRPRILRGRDPGGQGRRAACCASWPRTSTRASPRRRAARGRARPRISPARAEAVGADRRRGARSGRGPGPRARPRRGRTAPCSSPARCRCWPTCAAEAATGGGVPWLA